MDSSPESRVCIKCGEEMIYILKTQESMPHWYEGFCDNMYQALALQGADTRLTVKDSFNNISSSDFLFITSYKDLDLICVRNTNAKVLYYHQGSGACPYFEFINRNDERTSLRNVDIHLFSLPTFEKLTAKKYFLSRTHTIGFPLDLDVYKKYTEVKKKKKIVVSGHISPGKQFYLATFLLKDLMPEYEVWFSVIERPHGVSGHWMSFYALQEFKDMGFKFVQNHETQEAFYEFLSDSSHVFTCSLADTISLPIVEGYLCGCKPIVPFIEGFWPQFSDYISNGYLPFSKESIERWFKVGTSVTIDLDLFDRNIVAKKLLTLIGEYV